ncbi:MAG: fibronectin type III domain-containing protein, partial [Candidatus Muiribacteriota bacterium]
NSEYYKIYINDEFYKDGIYKTEYDLKNLYPENLYRIKVSAVNFLGEGELSDEHEFITPEFVDKTKVLQKITISRDKLVLPANGDFDLRRINVTAHYSDGNAESVSTAVWHIMNGQGSINDKIFYPTGEDGEATLRCIYTKNGITKYAFLPVEYKVAFSDPEALIISQTSHSMRVNESFNLNSVYGVILFEDGYELDVNELIWEVVEGSGIISNNIITAGNITGDIKLVAKAYYQEFELTQEFTISILKSATGISLSHSYALVKVNFQYDLDAVKVFLNFNDGSTEEVSGHVWQVVSGSGTVAGNIFTAPPSASITVLKCPYLYESELYEEEFTISNERTLHNLTLSENHILVRINTIYNLQNIEVIANYDDGSFVTVNPNNVSWQKIAGRGSVSGYSFNAMSIIGNSLVRVTYEEEGVTRTADLSITIGEVPAKPSGVVCSNISSTSFNISWNTVFGADSYNLYINNILYAEQISNTSIEISDRNPGTVYYIRVSAYNQAGEGELSNQITVLTIPAQPVNVSLDSSTTTTITFSWDSVAGASEYIIFVNGSIKAAGIGTTYYTAASLLPGTSYYIQVSARNQTGEGMKSSGQMFDTKLNAPSGLSYNEITQNSFRFFWNALPGADYYRVYKDGIFYAETTENWHNIIELLPGTLYKMRVSAVKNLQEGSISYEFNTYTVPPAPTSISHVGTTSSTVSILWQAVSGASFYKLTMNGVQYGGDTTQTLMNVTGLVPGFSYDFNVYAGNTGGYSDISETISVQMLSMPPGGIVSSFLTSNGLLLTWENAFGATGYRVYIDNVLYTSTTSNTYMNITGLVPDTDYFLSVSSVNSSGEGEKSSQIHIRTLP